MAFNIEAGTHFVVDIDGTVSEFVPEPDKAVIVPLFLNAARRYNELHPGKFHFVTGRDLHDAEKMIHPADGTTARLPYLANHGMISVDQSGQAVNLPYTQGEKDFIQFLVNQTVDFFQSEYPGTVFDLKKDAALNLVDLSGVNTSRESISGPLVEIKQDGVITYLKFMQDPAARLEAAAKVKGFLTSLCANALNPALREEMVAIQDDSGQVASFAVKEETSDQLEVRGPFSKGATLFAHGILDSDHAGKVACLVDTLGPSGTDRTMAKAVRQLAGQVVLVLNDRPQNHPQPGDVVYPDISFQTPTSLAMAFNEWVLKQETAAKPKPVPAASFDLG